MQYLITILATFLATALPIFASDACSDDSNTTRLNTTITRLNTTSSVTLNLPPVGTVEKFSDPQIVADTFDGGMKEFDRGVVCTEGENGSDAAVFILEDGASLNNTIIGAGQLDGVHCLGACTLTNVFFRDVCEDAITLMGAGNVTITGGGAQNATDKVIQHNGRGTVTVTNFTCVDVGKVYRSCGDCTENGGPRNVIITGLRAKGVTAAVVGINFNFNDTAAISGSCGSGQVCQEFTGVDKSKGIESPMVSSKDGCRGDQGKLDFLPPC